MKKNFNNLPSWYWKKGLHDAAIISVSKVDLEYDYSQHNPIRNYFLITLDTSKALFDTTIKELRFTNATILSDEYSYQGYWWVDDSVEFNGKKYIITINIMNHRDRKKLIIQCDDVIIIRNYFINNNVSGIG